MTYKLRGIIRGCLPGGGYPDTQLGVRTVAVLIARPQDVDLLIGLYRGAEQRDDLRVLLWVLEDCIKRDPDVLNRLARLANAVDTTIKLRWLARILPALMHLDAFINTRESTGGKYKMPDLITDLANASGIPTYTLQHGFENVGLTYFDQGIGPNTGFASRTVLTWGRVKQLPDWVPAATRNKIVAVGCPKPFTDMRMADRQDLMRDDRRPLVAVFENLKWLRYDYDYINRFIETLMVVSRHRPDIRFVLKSHPGATKERAHLLSALFRRLDSVEVIDYPPADGSQPTTAFLLTCASAVITTPSTIALDAAVHDKPVAVARYGLDLAAYAPLSMLDGRKDWDWFLDQLSDIDGNHDLTEQSRLFVERAIVPGDAVSRILDLVSGH